MRLSGAKGIKINMAGYSELSINTKAYLDCFYSILNEMMEQMTSAPQAGGISGNFIVQMMPHHRAAIKMSENLLRYTTFIPLQNMALNIIAEQKKSIENMKKVYPCCCTLVNKPGELQSYRRDNERILQNMFREMKSAGVDNNINVCFMREMIPHHRGAVLMCENMLRYPCCPELLPILEAITVSQKRGIIQMQQMLKEIRF